MRVKWNKGSLVWGNILIDSSLTFFSSSIWLGLFIFRGLEDEAKKAMLSLRGPNYLMNAELEELKTILASEKQFSELAYASKYKELGSKKAFLLATIFNRFIAVAICHTWFQTWTIREAFQALTTFQITLTFWQACFFMVITTEVFLAFWVHFRTSL